MNVETLMSRIKSNSQLHKRGKTGNDLPRRVRFLSVFLFTSDIEVESKCQGTLRDAY